MVARHAGARPARPACPRPAEPSAPGAPRDRDRDARCGGPRGSADGPGLSVGICAGTVSTGWERRNPHRHETVPDGGSGCAGRARARCCTRPGRRSRSACRAARAGGFRGVRTRSDAERRSGDGCTAERDRPRAGRPRRGPAAIDRRPERPGPERHPDSRRGDAVGRLDRGDRNRCRSRGGGGDGGTRGCEDRRAGSGCRLRSCDRCRLGSAGSGRDTRARACSAAVAHEQRRAAIDAGHGSPERCLARRRFAGAARAHDCRGPGWDRDCAVRRPASRRDRPAGREPTSGSGGAARAIPGVADEGRRERAADAGTACCGCRRWSRIR